MGLFGGPPDVYKLKAKGDVKGLTKALRYKNNWHIRQAAAFALGEIGDPRCIRSLTVALNDSDSYDVRLAAVRALAKFGSPAVEPLCYAVKVPALTEKAAEALGKIGDPRAVEPLGDVLREGRYAGAAVAALARIGTPAVETLLAAMKVGDPQVRRTAIEALGNIGDTRAVEPLLAALNDADSRFSAIKVLGEIGDRRAVGPLTMLLSDKDRTIRSGAVKALEKLGWQPDNVESEIIYAIAYEDWDRCVKIGTPAVELLISTLLDEDMRFRQNAAKVLGRIGNPQAIDPLGITLKEKDMFVAQAAAQALGKIGTSEAVRVLGGALSDESISKLRGENVVRAMGKVGTPALEFLIIALKDSHIWVRECAAEELTKMKLPQALTALIAGLRDEWRGVRSITVSAMEEQGDVRAVRPLMELAQEQYLASSAIKALCSVLRRHAKEVDSETLRSIVNVDNVVQIRATPNYCANDPDSPASFEEKVDCWEVRQLARQELIRRGLQA